MTQKELDKQGIWTTFPLTHLSMRSCSLNFFLLNHQTLVSKLVLSSSYVPRAEWILRCTQSSCWVDYSSFSGQIWIKWFIKQYIVETWGLHKTLLQWWGVYRIIQNSQFLFAPKNLAFRRSQLGEFCVGIWACTRTSTKFSWLNWLKVNDHKQCKH